MSDNEFILRVEGLSKDYYLQNGFKQSFKDLVLNPFRKKEMSLDKVEALKDVSFNLKRGDSLGIIGLNGAGKSTLLRILSSVTAPTSGKVILNGTVRSVLDVGTGFHPDLTGKENVYLSGEILGLSRSEIDKKYDEIVDFSEIEEFIHTPVKYYSSGMYLRLAFSTIAFLHADILLFDEAISAGDAGFKRKLINRMKVLRESGVTMIMVSHNFNEIFSLCSDIILLEKGEIKAHGPAYEVAAQYLEQLWIRDQSKENSAVQGETEMEQMMNSLAAEFELEESKTPAFLRDKKLLEEQARLKLKASEVPLTEGQSEEMPVPGTGEAEPDVYSIKLNGPDKKWDDLKSAPGNDQLRVLRATLMAEGKEADAPMFVDEPLTLQLKIKKLTDKQSHIGISISGSIDNVLFAFTTNLHNKTNEYRLPGHYSLEFHIPANTFNRGIFEIKLAMLEEKPETIPKMEYLLIFKMEYPNDLPDRELMEHYPGPLRFDLPCIVTKQD